MNELAFTIITGGVMVMTIIAAFFVRNEMRDLP